ncbi:glycosyltransferase family 4 protein [Algisphaera agarilytica]|uniref:Glycosyltransferase involved in cell wall biosynthesis n=1 Tax=Algisphaera agarilytica TaxID=1385975 RepID=A0A7X0H6H3_9BACT|nr:glycosyltransferase family 4 protein [Algisphaera agarilytica]MBB6428991.1 glycosyltransferase involved in cell wall biosynthesis [Algisphaera agarilytica]
MAKVLQLYNIFGAATERTMLEVPLALAQRGHDMTFAAETIADDAPEVTQRVLGLERIHVEPAEDIGAQMRAIAEQPPAIDESFDLVHGHFGPRALHAARYLHRGVPTLITTYGYDVSRLLRDPCWAERYRWMGERGATFVALSESMAQTLRACAVPVDRVEVIPLGIELPRWVYEPQPCNATFLFVGRFVDKKAPDDAIQAMATIRGRGVKATLKLIGSGDPVEEQRLRELVESLGLASAVEFVGRVPYDALAEAMRHATALVTPSRVAEDGDAEGCPMVLMQAQAVGTPVITTRHSGNPEALPSEAQRFVVEERDATALADAMNAKLNFKPDERAQLQQAGRRWIESRFDISQTVERYDALYRRLVDP